jgi:hypothetical protein
MGQCSTAEPVIPAILPLFEKKQRIICFAPLAPDSFQPQGDSLFIFIIKNICFHYFDNFRPVIIGIIAVY